MGNFVEYPTCMYRVEKGKLEHRVFVQEEIPLGWYEDKHQAAKAANHESAGEKPKRGPGRQRKNPKE